MWIYLMAFYTHTPNYGFYCHIETCDRQLFFYKCWFNALSQNGNNNKKKHSILFGLKFTNLIDIGFQTLDIVINLINSIAISGYIIICENYSKLNIWNVKLYF